MKAPCGQCPFRKDSLKGWLGKARMTELCEADSFVCHKTAYGAERDRKQCAGHMILRGEGNKFVHLAKRLGFDLGLRGHDKVFESTTNAINHHDNS